MPITSAFAELNLSMLPRSLPHQEEPPAPSACSTSSAPSTAVVSISTCSRNEPGVAPAEKPGRFEFIREKRGLKSRTDAWRPKGTFREGSDNPGASESFRFGRYAGGECESKNSDSSYQDQFPPHTVLETKSSWAASPPQSQEVPAVPLSQPGSQLEGPSPDYENMSADYAESSVTLEGRQGFENMPVVEWTEHHVRAWVSSLAANIARYAELFFDDGIDGSILLEMDADEWTEWMDGMETVAGYKKVHKKVIRKKIDALKRRNATRSQCEGQVKSTGS